MTAPLIILHPADQAARDRHHRAMNGPGGTMAPRCDHHRRIGECAVCIQLRHAEEGSIAVRSLYAFGDWPPTAAAAATAPATGQSGESPLQGRRRLFTSSVPERGLRRRIAEGPAT